TAGVTWLAPGGHHRARASFPTRRSSDLRGPGRGRGGAGHWRTRGRGSRHRIAGDGGPAGGPDRERGDGDANRGRGGGGTPCARRSEEHTSELQSRENLVCRLLLETKKAT